MKAPFYFRTVVGSLIGLAVLSSSAQSPSFPQQPIRVVVPATAGGGTDVIARILANAISANTKWSIIVENRPGASGIIGMDAVAKAKPDGHTLGLGLTATYGINPELFRKLPYDPTKDVVPVANIAEQPLLLVVRADSPYKTAADLAAAIKSGQLSMATAGAGSAGQLVGEMYGRVVGGKFTSVPYKGSAPAIQDVVGGLTDFMFAVPPAALPLLQGGRLRALAVTSTRRLPLVPDVPTMVEAGYKGFYATESKVLFAPAGIPKQVLDRINQEVQKALGQPTNIARILADGNFPLGGTAADASKFVNSEMGRWSAMVRESGLSKSN